MQRSDALKKLQQAGISEDDALSMVAESLPGDDVLPVPSVTHSALSEEEEDLLNEMGMPIPDNIEQLELQNRIALKAAHHRMVTMALSVNEAARRLGVTENRVRQRIRDRTLIGVQDGDGHYVLPRFQFVDDGGQLPHLKEVLRAFWKEVQPLSIMEFFETPTDDLDEDTPVSPRDWLLSMRPVEPVIHLAREY